MGPRNRGYSCGAARTISSIKYLNKILFATLDAIGVIVRPYYGHMSCKILMILYPMSQASDICFELQRYNLAFPSIN